MLDLRKVAVTGGMSSGKSAVCSLLSQCGAYVVDSDEIVHRLLTSDSQLSEQVIELLGSEVVVERQIDRARVAEKVFEHPQLLRSLELLLHPKVYEEIATQYQNVRHSVHLPPLFVAEVPLLFESGGETFFDKTIAVVSNQEECWERYRKKTGQEREDFNRRSARQMDQHKKAKKADYVIENNSTLEDLRQSVRNLYNLLTIS